MKGERKNEQNPSIRPGRTISPYLIKSLICGKCRPVVKRRLSGFAWCGYSANVQVVKDHRFKETAMTATTITIQSAVIAAQCVHKRTRRHRLRPMTATIAGEPVHTVHTRRAHACSFCDGQIPIGASVITWTILVGGEGWTRYYAHHACDVEWRLTHFATAWLAFGRLTLNEG